MIQIAGISIFDESEGITDGDLYKTDDKTDVDINHISL